MRYVLFALTIAIAAQTANAQPPGGGGGIGQQACFSGVRLCEDVAFTETCPGIKCDWGSPMDYGCADVLPGNILNAIYHCPNDQKEKVLGTDRMTLAGQVTEEGPNYTVVESSEAVKCYGERYCLANCVITNQVEINPVTVGTCTGVLVRIAHCSSDGEGSINWLGNGVHWNDAVLDCID